MSTNRRSIAKNHSRAHSWLALCPLLLVACAGGNGPGVDTLSPAVAAGSSPQPNAAGWNSTDVTITLTAEDGGGSGLESITYDVDGVRTVVAGSTAAVSFTSEGSSTLTFFATDKAGNVASAQSLTVRIDKARPTIVGSRSPAANAAGWNNADVTVSFSCADNAGGSGIALDTVLGTTLSTEGGDQSVISTGDCVDLAGNKAAPATVGEIAIDRTLPLIAGSRSLAANAAGWNSADVTITLTAEGSSGSGVESITYDVGSVRTVVAGSTAAVSFTSEGTSTLTFFATDKAGNAAAAQNLIIRIDKTLPSIAGSRSPVANAAGWNKADVTVSFSCADNAGGSGIALDTILGTMLSTEGEDQSVTSTGNCLDLAGNEAAPATVGAIHIDRTLPIVVGSRSPAANAAGWNKEPVAVSFACADESDGSGVAIDTLAGATVSTDGSGRSVTSTGKCIDIAGNAAVATAVVVNLDRTLPLVVGSRNPAANTYGWNTTPVTVSFGCTDALSGVATPPPAVVLSSDGAGQSASGTCADNAGNSAAATVSGIKIDLICGSTGGSAPSCTACESERTLSALANGGFESDLVNAAGTTTTRLSPGTGTWRTMYGSADASANLVSAVDGIEPVEGSRMLKTVGTNILVASAPIPTSPDQSFSVGLWARISGVVQGAELYNRFQVELVGYADVDGTNPGTPIATCTVHRLNAPSPGRAFAVHGGTDDRWQYYHWAFYRAGPDIRSFRIQVKHWALGASGTSYIDGVHVTRARERVATLDPDLNRERLHSDTTATDYSWFQNNEDWSSRSPGVAWNRENQTEGVVTISGPGAALSERFPYKGEEIRLQLRSELVGRTTDLRLGKLMGYDERGAEVCGQPVARGSGAAGWTLTDVRPGAFPSEVKEVRLRLAPALGQDQSIRLDHVAVVLRDNWPQRAVKPYGRNAATVSVFVNDPLGRGFENPIWGVNTSYAVGGMQRPRVANLEAVAPVPAAAPIDPVAQQINYAPTFRSARIMGLYLSDMQKGKTILAGDFSSIDTQIDNSRRLGYRLMLDIGSPPAALSVAETNKSWWNRHPIAPDKYGQYKSLNKAFALHLLDRYGRAEVESWYFLVHNEPDSPEYFEGTFDEYAKMFDYATEGFAEAARERGGVAFRLGGLGHTSNMYLPFIERFVRHCAKGVNYATGQIGNPHFRFLDYHEYSALLLPDLKATTLALERVLDVLDRHGYSGVNMPEITVSEFNIGAMASLGNSWDHPLDHGNRSLSGAFLVRGGLDLARRGVSKLIVHASHELQTKPSGPEWTSNWGLRFDFLDSHGTVSFNQIVKPNTNAVRILGKIPAGLPEVRAESSNEPVAANAYYDQASGELWVLVTSYEDKLVDSYFNCEWPNSADVRSIKYLDYTTNVSIRIANLPVGTYRADLMRVDPERANAYAAWRRLVTSREPLQQEIQNLRESDGSSTLSLIREAAVLRWEAGVASVTASDGAPASLTVPLRNHSVNLFRIARQ